MSKPKSLSPEEERALQGVLSAVFRSDFPSTPALHAKLYEAAKLSLLGAQQRVIRTRFGAFLAAAGGAWKRYELYEQFWTLTAPKQRKPWEEDDEEFDPCPDLPSKEDALAHWITMSVLELTRRSKFLEDAADRPFWQLVSSGCPYKSHRASDGRTEHHTHAFWAERPIPGPRLDCRCRMRALTRVEAKAKGDSVAQDRVASSPRPSDPTAGTAHAIGKALGHLVRNVLRSSTVNK